MATTVRGFASADLARFSVDAAHFLRDAGRDGAASAVERHAASAGKRAAGLVLRDTRSRWGSCSARGTLNFSWRLILAPPFVLDYLAAHEVAHLVHMNHSAAFWVGAAACSDIADSGAWLKQNGASPAPLRYAQSHQPAGTGASVRTKVR